MMLARRLLASALVAVAAGLVPPGPAAESRHTIAGMVRVTDGDSLWVGGDKVRLFGIDAPEVDQQCTRLAGQWDCGREAARMMLAWADGRHAECEVHDVDRYQRLVATCLVDGRDLGAAMVRAGYALAYRRYSERYVPEEQAAARDRAGMWSGEFDNPWDHRRSGGARAPSPNCRVKGNVNSRGQRIYHVPGGQYYNRVIIRPWEGDQCFVTEAEARAAGFRRARR